MSRVVTGTVEPYGSQSHLTESDIIYIESLKSKKRQAEVASWRSLLRSFFEITSDILYHPSGAPYISNSNQYISVSHSSTSVAVMLSDAPCAIDIESTSRDFARVASRYVTADEAALLQNKPLLLPVLWSAKEVLYKLSPLDGLNLLEDLHILSIDNCLIRGSVNGCDGEIKMQYFVEDEDIVVHTA
ncbi:MAG: 4'-phosphopantetheinyl transferase superfamily protein [Rikenellaceae bacterium]